MNVEVAKFARLMILNIFPLTGQNPFCLGNVVEFLQSTNM